MSNEASAILADPLQGYYMRQSALDLAIRANREAPGPEPIIAAAEAFLAFLTSEETPQPGEAEAPRRGRPRKTTDTPTAAASEPQGSDGTGQPAPASTLAAAAAQASPAAIVDAGTGKPVVAAEGISDEDWATIKGRAAKLSAMTDGDEALRAIIKGLVAEGAKQSIGAVREAGRQAEFAAAVEAKLASLEALAD